MKRIYVGWLGVLVFVWVSLGSCQKDRFTDSSTARLTLTADTIKFDTVFTTTGSVTQSFKIINENDQALRISTIKLMGGPTSAFRININGLPTNEAFQTEIAARDSMYIFVAVTINPGSANLPFLVNDSIQIAYNGNTRYVMLEAYGQNAYFLRNERITADTQWTNDLPYVILGGLRIDSAVSLTLSAGCRVYAHAGATITVDGSLQCNGTKNNEVIFTGDRLDEPYRDLPGAWPGIVFSEQSKNNRLSFTVINNAFRAIQSSGPSLNSNPKLLLEQCIINNAQDYGILAVQSNLQANNSLVSNCGSNISIQYGGQYAFTHCTVAAYSNQFLLHEFPVIQISNAYFQNGGTQTASLNATFQNCIFWGDGGVTDDEFQVQREGNDPFSVLIENCLLKATQDPMHAQLVAVISNQDPLFDSIDIGNKYYDFRFSRSPFSPAVDQGTGSSFPKDLDDLPRVVGLAPDMGCYERQ